MTSQKKVVIVDVVTCTIRAIYDIYQNWQREKVKPRKQGDDDDDVNDNGDELKPRPRVNKELLATAAATRFI